MKITKNAYLTGFSVIVLLLALVRLICPSVATPQAQHVEQNDSIESAEIAEASEQKTVENAKEQEQQTAVSTEKKEQESAEKQPEMAEVSKVAPIAPGVHSKFFNPDGTEVKHRILSVPRYADAFPDSQSVQIVSAQKWGVQSVQNREEAENRKRELVFVGSNPYYYIEKMNRSIPYLVPRAAVLLNDIGRAFFDSLQVKQVPLHKFIVTSVLRTKDDVKKLRNYNGNATENSCHLYGTTFDICYNRYKTVQAPDGSSRRQVQNDTLKWVLSEVLNDMRLNQRCYVKYEVKQGCFHITVR